MVSERFELGRNFCNKLWNAARFALMNLEGYTPARWPTTELAVEDRWILSRLATVTDETTDGARDLSLCRRGPRALRLCLERVLQLLRGDGQRRACRTPAARPVAQRVLAHTLDALVRLLHPMIPFITEEIWQLLAEAAPQRGLDCPQPAAESVMIAPWPEADAARQDAEIEARFASFRKCSRACATFAAGRTFRPRRRSTFCRALRRGDRGQLLAADGALLRVDGRRPGDGLGPGRATAARPAQLRAAGAEVFVDLAEHIDVEAEIARQTKERDRSTGAIAAKETATCPTRVLSAGPRPP